MRGCRCLEEEINFIRSAIIPIVEKHHPSKANHEKMSLYDLITFGVMAQKHFDGIYKKVYGVLIEDLKPFPKVRYNKVVERLNRCEKLLIECLGIFKLENRGLRTNRDKETLQAREA